VPGSIRQEPGAHKGQLTISINVLNVASASSIALKDALDKMLTGILKLTFIIVRDAVFVPGNAGQG
jgi:hypothetical protein